MEAIAAHLQQAVSGTTDTKVTAIRLLRSELSSPQACPKKTQSISAIILQSCVSRFVDDPDERIAVAACDLLRDLLVPRSDTSRRLAYGQGLYQLRYNPLQTYAFKNKALFRSLVKALHCGVPAKEDAAEQALLAACMHNKSNTVKYVRHLVSQIMADKASRVWSRLTAALEHLPRLPAEVEVEIDQILMPALWVFQGIRGSDAEEQAAAMEVLGMIVERRPAAKDFIILKGALMRVSKLLVEGDLQLKDASAHLLKVLLEGNKQLLTCYETLLGQPRDRLVAALKMVVRSTDQPALPLKPQLPDIQALGTYQPSRSALPGGLEAEGPCQCSNGDDARELLHALASVDPLVKWEEDEDVVAGATTCRVM